jgi:hypothetical protein
MGDREAQSSTFHHGQPPHSPVSPHVSLITSHHAKFTNPSHHTPPLIHAGPPEGICPRIRFCVIMRLGAKVTQTGYILYPGG